MSDNTERGAKHRCFSCQTAFYDLRRPKIVCPRCGVDQATEPKHVKPAAAKRGRKKVEPKVVAAAPEPDPAADEADEELEAATAVEEDDDDDDDDVPEDDEP